MMEQSDPDIEKRVTVHHHFSIVEVLEKIPLFKGLSLRQFKKIIGICTKQNISKNQFICRAREESLCMFILLQGILQVVLEDGKEVSRINPISTVGEMGVFTGENRSANIISGSDGIILEISKADLMRVLREDVSLSTQVLFNVINELSLKIRRDNLIIDGLRQMCPPEQWTKIIQEANKSVEG